MKITTKVLCRRTRGTLSQTHHLDMSNLGIGTVEGLEHCPKLQSLDASSNCLEEFENFECCKHLWRINLSNNKISCLVGFSKIYALGSLDLSNNRVSWKELAHLRNVFILDLRLHGNFALENDTYYRLHVIDCLPNIWMLDGRLVTSAERLQVSQFFHDSALSSRPVRHKLTRNPFKSNSSKCKAIYGDRTCLFATSFPNNEPQNSECDRRRLEFLAKNVEMDLKLRSSNIKEICNHPNKNWLSNLIKYRSNEKEKCNMLLLLLIASLEFKVPVDLLKQTVDVAKLNPLFEIDCKKIFDLDITAKTEAICLLVSACKLDRDMKGKTEGHFSSGGLYDRLYLCLYHAVAHLITAIADEGKRYIDDVHADIHRRNQSRPHTAPPKSRSFQQGRNLSRQKTDWKVHQRLLGSELVLLLSVVPSFYNYIALKNQSICKLLYIATGDPRLASRLARLAEDLSVDGGDINSLYHEICKSVKRRILYAAQNTSKSQASSEVSVRNDFDEIHLNVGTLSKNTKEARFILNASYSYPKRPKSAILSSGEHLITGKSRPTTTTNSMYTSKSVVAPHLGLGSQILLGAQNLSRVIALPEQNVALVQMDSVPAPNGSIVVQTRDLEEHYCYVDVNLLEFDAFSGYWKPQGAVGDKITLQAPTPLTENSEVTCLEVDKQMHSPHSKPDTVAWVNHTQAHTHLPSGRVTILKTAHSNTRGSSHYSTQTGKVSRIYSPKPTATTHEANEIVTSATPLRPLSSMFCEKMDLSLSAAVLESGVIPMSFQTDSMEPGAEDFFNLDVQQRRSTLVADSVFQNNTMAQMQINIDLPTEEEQSSSMLYHYNEDEASINMNMQDKQKKNLQYDNTIQAVMEPGVTNDHDIHLHKDKVIEERESKGEDEEPSSNLDHDALPENGIKMSTLATIRIPSPESNGAVTEFVTNTGGDVMEAADDENDLDIAADNEISIVDSATVGQDANNFTWETRAVSKIKDKTLNQDLHMSKNLSRRVQSARVSGSKSGRKTSEASRPYSAVVSRPKHVMFGDNDQDSDSRPGSASSFQLQRTEAWRSSASSGSAALGEAVMSKSYGLNELRKSYGSSRSQTLSPNQHKVKFAGGQYKTPPQRPTSPDQEVNDNTEKANKHDIHRHTEGKTSERATPNKITHNQLESSKGTTLLASCWLAQGRDVHYEKQQYRRLITSPRLPGYLEGTGVLPSKPKKTNESCASPLKSDIALHLLPSRPTKAATKLAHSSLRRSFEGHNLPQSALGGSLAWSKPKFSALQDLKKLTNKPASPLSRTRQSLLRRKFN